VDLLSLADEPVCAQHLQELQSLAGRVRVVSLSKRAKTGRLIRAFLTGRSLTEGYFGSPEYARAISEWRSEADYDLFLAVCSSTGAYLLDGIRPKRLIVDLVDVDSAKWRMYAARHWGLAKWIYARESRTVAKLERRLSACAERCVTVSERECEELAEVSPEANRLAIPNGVDTEYFKPAESDGPIDRVVFVGQMDYFPNVEAVKWFAGQVWPGVHERFPQLRWDIVGRRPTAAVRELASLPNVRVTGEVADVRPFLRSAVAIAPIQLSRGVQNKVLEALAAGRPVVASSAVAEGLDERVRKAVLVADSAEKWRASIETLVTRSDLSAQMGAAGRRVMEKMSWQRIGEAMLECVGGGRVSEGVETPSIDAGAMIC
jgi:sugar transferase (PEP-CTERM/EpsH1 system associated)